MPKIAVGVSDEVDNALIWCPKGFPSDREKDVVGEVCRSRSLCDHELVIQCRLVISLGEQCKHWIRPSKTS